MIENIKAQPLLELKDIIAHENIAIPIGFSCSIPTPNEPFSVTLKRCIEYVCFCDENQINEYNNILESFELYGTFLDYIPFNERYDFIRDELFEWFLGYLDNKDSKVHNKDYGEPPKEIKKDINAIEKFEDMIYKRLWAWNSEYFELLDNLVQELKKDLQEEKFGIIPKDSYYGFPITKKQDLTMILNKIIKRYKIKGASVDKKQLVDSIKTS